MKDECKDHGCSICRLLKDFARAYLVNEHTRYGKLKCYPSTELVRYYRHHLQSLQDKLERLEKELEQPEMLSYLDLILL